MPTQQTSSQAKTKSQLKRQKRNARLQLLREKLGERFIERHRYNRCVHDFNRQIVEADSNNCKIKEGQNPCAPLPVEHSADREKSELTERAANNQRKNQRSLGKQVNTNCRRLAHKERVAKKILTKEYTIEPVDRKAVDKFVIANSFGKTKRQKYFSHKQLIEATLFEPTANGTTIELCSEDEQKVIEEIIIE